jgi:predicted RNase H-like nuclease (RuvC/YqgF family)
MYDEFMEQKNELEYLKSKIIPLKDREIAKLSEELSKKLAVIQDLEKDLKKAEDMMHGIKYSLTD